MLRTLLILSMATIAGALSVGCTILGAGHPIVAEQGALAFGFAALFFIHAACKGNGK